MADSSSQTKKTSTRDHRDFPRLHVEAKVRIADTAEDDHSHDQPAVISDLSLGGARLSTPARLVKGQDIGIIPFSGMLENHPLHKILEFQVVWVGGQMENQDSEREWYQFGLIHKGSVLEVLNSWLGHLLLRRKPDKDIVVQRRVYRRIRFDGDQGQNLRARLSHDSRFYDLTLLDIAPGGLLARGETDEIPVGVHLELSSSFQEPEVDNDMSSLQGCVVDAHSHSGSTFYRVAFDPDCELDEENLVNWAQSVGGDLEI